MPKISKFTKDIEKIRKLVNTRTYKQIAVELGYPKEKALAIRAFVWRLNKKEKKKYER